MYPNMSPMSCMMPSPSCWYCMNFMGQPLKPIYREKAKQGFTLEEAAKIAKILGIDFGNVMFDLEQFRMGINTELEHGKRDPATNVTGNDPILTGKIALAHLKEFPDYYTRLSKLEEEAKAYWGMQK